MTCYDISSGNLPFEEFVNTQRDILHGARYEYEFVMQGIVFVAIYMDLNPTSTSAVLMALDQMMFPNFAPHLR